jgi:hypothetical protein
VFQAVHTDNSDIPEGIWNTNSKPLDNALYKNCLF